MDPESMDPELMDPGQQDAAAKAATLIESLPWLKKFHGQIMVVKFGGNAMIDEALKRSFAEDMAYLRYVGIHPVVVHGGGPQISAELERRGIRSRFRGGYRVTTAEAIDVVREVLSGQVSGEIVDSINEHEPLLGQPLSGEGGLFTARRRQVVLDGEQVDLGFVGDIVAVDPQPVLELLAAGRIPVVSSIAPDGDRPGDFLNVNADAAAAALAVALAAAKLVILTDVPGLYRDWPDRSSLISVIGVEELLTLLPGLESGMIPKMTACLDAVAGGVAKAAIIDGRRAHSILLEVFTEGGIGTEVVR